MSSYTVTTNPQKEIQHWFNSFESRRTNYKKGMPLWSLKVTDTELSDLQIILKQLFAGKMPHIVFNRYSEISSSAKFDQAFTLYLATWIQRNFQGGRERWPVVLASLGIKHENRLNTAIYSSVINGLKYWGIELYSTENSNQYFATLYCQGGFPRHGLIAEVDGKVSNYLHDVIEQFSVSHKTSSLATIARKRLEDLPETLRQEPFVTLASELISSLLSLRDRYHLYAESDPIAALQVKNSNWRNELPFLLCDKAATQLIERLLNRAASIIKRELNPVRIRRYLRKNLDSWSLVAQTYINNTIHPQDLSQVLGAINLPSYFDLYSQSSKGNRVLSASFNLKGQENKRWQVITKFTQLYDHDAASSINYQIWSDGELIGTEQYCRGEELSKDLPWVFSAEGDKYTFLGQGSISAKTEEVFVVYDKDIQPANSSSRVEKIGSIASLGRSVFFVMGKAEVRLNFGKITISTNAEETNEYSCWLKGEKSLEAISHEHVYVGKPRVMARFISNDTQVIPSNETYWKSIDSEKLVAIENEEFHYGLGSMLWIKDGQLKWQMKCAILPQNAQFHVVPYERGEIELKAIGFGNSDFGVINKESNWLREVDIIEDMFLAELQLPARMPDFFHPVLTWNQSLKNKITFQFASKQVGICLLTPDEKLFSPDFNSLTVDDLFSHKLKIKLSEGSIKLNISAKLITKEEKIKVKATLIEQVKLDNHVTKISSSILGKMAQDLFSQTDNLYDFVTFKFYSKDGHIDIPFPRVEAFKHSIKESKAQSKTILKIINSQNHKNLDFVELFAVPIWKLDSEHKKLVKPVDANDEALFLMPEEMEMGPWFVYAANDKKIQARIVMSHSTQTNTQDAQLTKLQIAIKELTFIRESFEFDYHEMDLCISDIMNDFYHPDWVTVQSFVNMLDIAIPRFFHLFRRLILQPDALVTLLLKQQEPEKFELIWSLADNMPFNWLDIPLSDWEKAIQLVLENVIKDLELLKNQMSEDEYISIHNSVVSASLHQLSEKNEYFKTLVELILEKNFGIDATWSSCPIFGKGKDSSTILDEFYLQKSALLDRKKGQLLTSIQNKHNDLALKKLLEEMPLDSLPYELRAFQPKVTEENKTKFELGIFTFILPIKIALKNAGLFGKRKFDLAQSSAAVTNQSSIFKNLSFGHETMAFALQSAFEKANIHNSDTAPVDKKQLICFALSKLRVYDKEWLYNSMSCALKAGYIHNKNNK